MTRHPYARILLSALVFVVVLGVPLLAAFAQSQQPLVPCEGTVGTKGCTAKMLTTLFMRVINFLITLAAIIAVIMFVWAGLTMVTANGNKSKIEHSKETLKNVIIGIVLTLAAWTIVDAVMRVFVGESLMNRGKWFEIGDAENPVFDRGQRIDVSGDPIVPGVAPTSPTVPGTSGTPLVPATNEDGTPRLNPDGTAVMVPDPNAPPGSSSSIAAAAAAAQGASTASGPGGGNVACAWQVNNVLQSAGVDPIDGNSVAAMEREIQAGRGTAVDQSSAQAGDLIFAPGGMSHVGICQNTGCSQVLSNSSGSASFSWVSGADFGTGAGAGRIYRVSS